MLPYIRSLVVDLEVRVAAALGAEVRPLRKAVSYLRSEVQNLRREFEDDQKDSAKCVEKLNNMCNALDERLIALEDRAEWAESKIEGLRTREKARENGQ